MHLASINSAEEQKDLQDHIQAYGEKKPSIKFSKVPFLPSHQWLPLINSFSKYARNTFSFDDAVQIPLDL